MLPVTLSVIASMRLFYDEIQSLLGHRGDKMIELELIELGAILAISALISLLFLVSSWSAAHKVAIKNKIKEREEARLKGPDVLIEWNILNEADLKDKEKGMNISIWMGIVINVIITTAATLAAMLYLIWPYIVDSAGTAGLIIVSAPVAYIVARFIDTYLEDIVTWILDKARITGLDVLSKASESDSLKNILKGKIPEAKIEQAVFDLGNTPTITDINEIIEKYGKGNAL